MRMILFVTLLGSLFVQAQETKIKKVPITRTSATSGQEMFVTYCAVCHGKDGKGDGPAVEALKGKPADLTQLAKKNGGKYPENHVVATISSVSTPAHGSKEMPMWGPLFSSVSSNQGEVHLRVANLTRYIETLQEK
jgi:mono/diheme cytochrome c family protein